MVTCDNDILTVKKNTGLVRYYHDESHSHACKLRRNCSGMRLHLTADNARKRFVSFCATAQDINVQ